MKEVVIKIPDETYRAIVSETYCNISDTLWRAIVNGKVLPKGHDALVDRGEILKHEVFVKIGEEGYEDYAIPVDCLSEAQTIIEADKGDEE